MGVIQFVLLLELVGEIARDLDFSDFFGRRIKFRLAGQHRSHQIGAELRMFAGVGTRLVLAIGDKLLGQAEQIGAGEQVVLESLGRHALGVAAQQDVRAAPRHVGGNRHCSFAPRLGHNQRLRLVHFGVEHLVGHFFFGQQTVDHFRVFDRGGADQHRPSCLAHALHFLHNGLVFGAFVHINLVGKIEPLEKAGCLFAGLDIGDAFGAIYLFFARLYP